MKKYLLIETIAILSLCLCSCEEESHGRTGGQEGTVPIGFIPEVTTPTRATDFTPDNLADFGVLAYFTQGRGFNPSSTPNFMYNQKIEKSGSSWTYSPAKFWPANTNDKLSFFAYAPHNATGLTLPGITSTGYPSFDYQIQSTEAAQTDLLLAKPMPDKAATDGTIRFGFKHALTRVVFEVEAGSGFTGVTVNNFAIQTKKSGTVAFTSTTSPTDWMRWSNITSGAGNNISCTATLPPPSNTISAGSTQKIASFFLLPVASVGSSEAATLTFTYTMNGVGDTKTLTNLQLPSMNEWLPSASITYKLKITRSAVTGTVSSIGVWSGTTVNVDTGGEIAPGYKATDIKPGDYYYDDGTWSDGGYRMLVDGSSLQYDVMPTSGKTCLGIVYANGKTGTERGDNVSNYSGTGLTEIKGYVMALEMMQGRRGGGGSGNTTDFNGYTNTQSLSTTVSAARELREQLINSVAAPPTSTSGWYIMSLGQTTYAYENRDIINKSKTKASSGNYNFSDLWTSSRGGSYPWVFNNGSHGDAGDHTIHNAYPCFTF